MSVQTNNIIIPDTNKAVGLNVLVSGLNEVFMKEAVLMVLYSDAMRQLNDEMSKANGIQKGMNEDLYKIHTLYKIDWSNNNWALDLIVKSAAFFLNLPEDFYESLQKPGSTQQLTTAFMGLIALSYVSYDPAAGEELTGAKKWINSFQTAVLAKAQKTVMYGLLIQNLYNTYYSGKKALLTSSAKKMDAVEDTCMNNINNYQEGYDNLSKTESSAAKAIQQMIQNDNKSKIKK